LIGLINSLPTNQIYAFELRPKVLIFRGEKRVKDVIPDARTPSGGFTLFNFHPGLVSGLTMQAIKCRFH